MVKKCQVCGLKQNSKSKGMWFYRPHCKGKELPKDFHLCKDHAKEYWEEHNSSKNIKITLSLLKARHKKKA